MYQIRDFGGVVYVVVIEEVSIKNVLPVLVHSNRGILPKEHCYDQLEVDEFWTYVGYKKNKVRLIYTYHISQGYKFSISGSKSKDWIVFSPSLDGGIGAGVNTVITGSATRGMGKTRFLDKIGKKSILETLWSYRKILTTF